VRLRRHPELGEQYADPDQKRRFIRGLSEDAKFESERGSSSAKPLMQEPGRLGNASSVQPEDGIFGAPRRTVRWRSWKSEDSGRLEDLLSETLEDRNAGETRSQIAGNIGGVSFGETRRSVSRWSRRRRFRVTWKFASGPAKRCRSRGNPETRRKADGHGA